MTYIRKTLGSYNIVDPSEKQWSVCLYLPEDAPKPSIYTTWDEDDDPYIEEDDTPPSEAIEIISKRLESYWISSRRDEDRKTIQWVRENSERLDKEWAEEVIKVKEKRIESLKEDIKGLENYL